jgi:hypothetical protein
MTAPRSHLFEDEHARVAKRSLDTQAQVSSALNSSRALATAFPAGNSLADQLRVVARLIFGLSGIGGEAAGFLRLARRLRQS